MIPKRIVRFLFECFKYGLISKEILEKINKNLFSFDNYSKEDPNLVKCIYLFVSNLPYIYNSLISENKEAYLNKLNTANNILKSNPIKLKTIQYKNKGVIDYLEKMIDCLLTAIKENKLNSDFILDLNDLENGDNEWKKHENDQDEEYIRNLGNLHASLAHVFESELTNKLNIEVKTNKYLTFEFSLMKIYLKTNKIL